MKCPACGAEISDEQALFCPRCGTSLGPSEGETTSRIDSPATTGPPGPAGEGDSTQEAAPGASSETSDARPESATALAADLAVAVRRAFVSGGWSQATEAAGFGFLALLAVGALFTGAVKIADSTFGSGESPLWILTRLVLFGLFSLGVPIEQGGVEISVVPMGALALIGAAIAWAAQRVVAHAVDDSPVRRALEGAKVGVPFSIMCLIASIVFRVGDGTALSADAGAALLLGGVWGGLFGAAGALRARGAPSEGTAMVPGSPVVRDGVFAGLTMLVSAAVLAAAALLLYLIIDLASGSAADLEAGQAVLVVFLLAAFAPNLVAGVISFSLGAPVSWGGLFGIGPNNQLSLFGWGGDTPPAYAYLALLIPLAACLFGGYAAWRRAHGSGKVVEILSLAAAIFAVTLTMAVWVGNADGSIGAGASFEIGPNALAVFFLGFAWAAACGWLGWKVGEAPITQQPPPSTAARPPPPPG